MLENQKDRAVAIHKIFLRLGHNYHIEIDNFEDSPKILQPYEVFKKNYDPIDFYAVNLNKIQFTKLWNNKKAKQKLILSTSEGRYVVKSGLNFWDPMGDFFHNHLSAVIRPMRVMHKGKAYGSNCIYIVEFKQGAREEVVPIYPGDYQINKFRNFSLSQASLESKDVLEEYLYEKVAECGLACDEIVVHDIEKWRKNCFGDYYKQTFTAEYYNWMTYRVFGRFATLSRDYKMRRRNRQFQKNANRVGGSD